MSLTNQKIAQIQRKKRGDAAIKLCIVMMISDRKEILNSIKKY